MNTKQQEKQSLKNLAREKRDLKIATRRHKESVKAYFLAKGTDEATSKRNSMEHCANLKMACVSVLADSELARKNQQ